LPTEIIPSQNLWEFADGKNPTAMPPVYTDGIILSVYTGGIADGEKSFFENCNGGMTWIFLRRICRQKYRGIQTRTAKQGRVANTGGITDGIFPSVILSEKPVYTGSADTLSSSLPLFLLLLPHPTSPLQTAANHPSQLSPLLNTS